MSFCEHRADRIENRRYCPACARRYARQWRKTHKMTEEQKIKANTRAYTNTLIRRGKIKRQPCKTCGAEKAQVHHLMYPNPWLIDWLCFRCHRAEHRQLDGLPPKKQWIPKDQRDTIINRARQAPVNPLHSQNYQAVYMREWRKHSILSDEQIFKSRARAYANVYLNRGKIDKHPCKHCGSKDSQMRHLDYSKPLLVEWVCRQCRVRGTKV